MPLTVENVVEIVPTEGETAKVEKVTSPVVETKYPLLDSWPLLNVNGAPALHSVVVLPFVVMYVVSTLWLMPTGPGRTVKRYRIGGIALDCAISGLQAGFLDVERLTVNWEEPDMSMDRLLQWYHMIMPLVYTARP